MADLDYELKIAFSAATSGDAAQASVVISRLRTLDLRQEIPAVQYLTLELIGAVRVGDRSRSEQLAAQVFAAAVPRAQVRDLLMGIPESSHQECQDFITLLTAEPKSRRRGRSAAKAPAAAPPPVQPAPSSATRPKRLSTPVLIILILSGLLLLGIVLVVIVVGGIAFFAASTVSGNVTQRTAQIEVNKLHRDVELFSIGTATGELPRGFSLTDLAKGQNPFITDLSDFMDPWGRPYQVVLPGDFNLDFDVISYGKDGLPGGSGLAEDIVSNQD